MASIRSTMLGVLVATALVMTAPVAAAHHDKGDHAGDDGTGDEPASPCQDWSGNATEGLPEPVAVSDDECLLEVENPPPNCVGPWPVSVGTTVGPVSVTVNACGPPGGIVEPTGASSSDCQDWAGNAPEHLPGPIGISDDECLAHVDTGTLYSCVGPWYKEKTTSAGPVAVTLLVCQPADGGPT